MTYTVTLDLSERHPLICLVGAGGTGSLAADGIARLLIPYPEIDFMIVDPDRVEEHNLRRQSFYLGDVGKFKSQVLAERLSRQYGRRIAYTVFSFDWSLLDETEGGGLIRVGNALIVGCVDNPIARKDIAYGFHTNKRWQSWWLDAGNSQNSGQVLLGNQADKTTLAGGFNWKDQKVSKLPIPSLQLPALLSSPVQAVNPRDCAEEVQEDVQSAVINHAMATLILEFIRRLLKGNLTYMGQYIDLDTGTLTTIPAEPVTIARMLSIKESDLVINKNK